MAAGTLYSDAVISPAAPYHRFLISELRTAPTLPRTAAILAEATERNIGQVIFSIEGLTGHIAAIRKDSAEAFNNLTQDWDVEIIVVVRDEAKWALSLYRQCIISPKLRDSASTLEQLYATALSYGEFASLRSVQDLSSHTMITRLFAAYFPKATVTFLRYEDNFIDSFAARCSIDQIVAAKNAPQSNAMPADCYLEFIRQMNGVSGSQLSDDLLRAAVASKTQTSNVHLRGYMATLPPGLKTISTGLSLYVQLGGIHYQDNPPLKTDVKTLDKARRNIRSQILSILFGRTTKNMKRKLI